jgi:hypothetical protein
MHAYTHEETHRNEQTRRQVMHGKRLAERHEGQDNGQHLL